MCSIDQQPHRQPRRALFTRLLGVHPPFFVCPLIQVYAPGVSTNASTGEATTTGVVHLPFSWDTVRAE